MKRLNAESAEGSQGTQRNSLRKTKAACTDTPETRTQLYIAGQG
jgi:hypothetical protein